VTTRCRLVCFCLHLETSIYSSKVVGFLRPKFIFGNDKNYFLQADVQEFAIFLATAIYFYFVSVIPKKHWPLLRSSLKTGPARAHKIAPDITTVDFDQFSLDSAGTMILYGSLQKVQGRTGPESMRS